MWADSNSPCVRRVGVTKEIVGSVKWKAVSDGDGGLEETQAIMTAVRVACASHCK